MTIDDEEAALNVQLAPIPVQIRLFRFDELAGRFGVLEAAFTEKSTLINVRVQLLFPGPDGIIKAACFWHDEFGPFVRSYFAPLCPGDHPIIGDAIRFSGQGMVGVARLLPGTNTVSFWLTDERYE